MTQNDLQNLKVLLDDGIGQHRAPCAVLRIVRLHDTDITLAEGTHTYDSDANVSPTDLFDMASLTKILATTALSMIFVQKGRLKLDDTIDTLLHERRRLHAPQPTFRQLLAHCGGLPPCLPFHRSHAHLDSIEQKRLTVVNTPLVNPPGTATAYSDIGFMLLAFALERLGDAPLDALAQNLVFRPLGMDDTRFKPPQSLHSRCVPTEQIPNSDPPQFWQGTVHDENARWLGGVAGHAGIFSTAADLARFARAFLNNYDVSEGHAETGNQNGIPRSDGLFAPHVIREFTRPARLVAGSSRCLGWDSPTQPGSSGGDNISPNGFGHTGFTGTSFWLDPVRKAAVILLTNAVHPSRDCKRAYFPWRNQLHTLALQ